MGVLLATGLIVGESLFGVVYAFAVAGAEKAGSTDSANVLALIPAYPQVMVVSVIVFAGAVGGLYSGPRTGPPMRRHRTTMGRRGAGLPLVQPRPR